MAGKKSLIGLELERYAKKISEFQDYLDVMDIRSIADDKLRQSEINVQRSLMLDLGIMLSQLEALRNKEEKAKNEIRGDNYVNPMMKKAMAGNNNDD